MADVSLYEAIGRNLGDVITKGTPTGATATTADSNSFMFLLAQQLQGKNVYLYEGEGAGQSRTITVFAPDNNRVTVLPDWATVPTANSRFIVFDKFKAEDYEHHMNRAMGQISLKYLSDMVASMALYGTQYEYPVPSGMEWINTIRIVPTSNSDYGDDSTIKRKFEFPPREWRIEMNSVGTYVITFDPRKVDMDSFDKDIVTVHGQGRPDFVATVIPADLEEFIVADATMKMAALMRGRGKEWDSIYYNAKDEVKGTRDVPGLEEYIFKYGAGKKVKP